MSGMLSTGAGVDATPTGSTLGPVFGDSDFGILIFSGGAGDLEDCEGLEDFETGLAFTFADADLAFGAGESTGSEAARTAALAGFRGAALAVAGAVFFAAVFVFAADFAAINLLLDSTRFGLIRSVLAFYSFDHTLIP